MSDSINSVSESAISQTDYLKLFMQELSYQDPMKPIDNREFMVQMAQFSSLQEARTTNESLQALMSMTNSNQSLMLLGKHVKITGSDAEGLVYKIQYSTDKPPQLLIAVNGGTEEKTLTDITDVW